MGGANDTRVVSAPGMPGAADRGVFPSKVRTTLAADKLG